VVLVHNGLPCDWIQGQSHETIRVRNSSIFTSVHHSMCWQMITDSQTRAQYLNSIEPAFDIWYSLYVSWHSTLLLNGHASYAWKSYSDGHHYFNLL